MRTWMKLVQCVDLVDVRIGFSPLHVKVAEEADILNTECVG